jgi:DNA-binding NarL/FixJ family response regulator
MKTFNVLFVDDQRAQMERTEALADAMNGALVLDYAASRSDALALIAANFYHLAIVDVSLQADGEPDEYGGLHVLSRLQELRPFCERLLLTTVNEDRHEVLEAFFPERGSRELLVHGFVDKMVTRLRAHEIVQDRAERWLANPVEMLGADEVLEQIERQDVRGRELSPQHGHIKPTSAEIESVLSKLFGQGKARQMSGIDSINSVELQRISEGWSKSVVLWCEPSIGDRPGPRCLVKVGPREDSIEEVERYESFVRFGLGLDHRVELLTYEVGDTIGAACYTHFEARGERQDDLQHLFNDCETAAWNVIRRLFDAESQSWTADTSVEEDLAGFFVREYRKPIRHLLKSLREFVDRSPQLSMNGDRTAVQWGERSLPIPTNEDLGLAAFSRAFPACIVHGDLHGGNVLVTGSGQPVLIDYRNMGRGPRVLDFVSMEVSVRMATGPAEELAELGPDLFDREQEWWRRDWQLGNGANPEPRPVSRPYLEEVSTVIRSLANKNHDEVTPTEYAATALLRSLRIMSASAPQDPHRLRLLPFLSMLTDVIRQSGGE